MDDINVQPKGDTVKQLSVMLQNRVGALSSIVRLLRAHSVEVIGISMQDSRDATVARMILSSPDEAAHLFMERGIPYTVCDMIVVGLRDSSEGLMKCLDILTAGETNLDFAYSMMNHPDGLTLLAMHLEDYEFGVQILSQAGIKILYQEDLSR